MDSKDSENKVSRPVRRSTRQTSVKVLSIEPTPRGPLKRIKKGAENRAPVAAVNGSRHKENGSEDEEGPSKKIRLDTERAEGGSGDENEMDVQESAEDMESDQNQEMDMERQDSSHGSHPPKICRADAIGDVNLFPRVVLHERCRSSHGVNEDAEWIKTNRVKPSTKGPAAPTKSAMQSRPPPNRHDVLIPKITSMAEYRKTMETKAKGAAIRRVNHLIQKDPASEKCTTERLNNIPIKKRTVQHKKQGFMWYLWSLVLLALLSSAALLAYNKIPVVQRVADLGRHLSRAVKPEMFANQLSILEAQFPSQRPELWKRSKIHLERHLKTAQPTAPVSLIFTAGRRAERTLHCLAEGLASSFSSALNASVLHIDGASKASQDSDEVKLDIDNQLKAAFEGGKPVAVIHRLEELPPGSTLIFYRYCDHESAAYKQVFLLFTVLLPQDEISSGCLKDVEEMVQDYVKERLVGSSSQTSFNEMDTDKYSGLWSRISHLILPVVSEEEVEEKGC
ncbi:torsin-1A-interacting protein 2-like isoform X1 [Xiphias gladius]|uniref:torsin-1A-interacting protein 2-like isoform X1 n=1 Tax=Xiphias gladius TaxID=8245 RepID=UPI001A994A06|nr:torsin-1A-interacting protein 2-like isoform X1 [Xiphias gladius]